MILRHDGSFLTVPLSEVELPKEPSDAVSLAGARPLASAMVGHRPVLMCGSGESTLPLAEQSYPVWLLDELVALKAVGA